jgi:cytosine deaminase
MIIKAVRNARVLGRDDLVDIVIEAGHIVALHRAAGYGPGVDVGGRAVLPGLVDAHVHLDKAYQLDALRWGGVPSGSLSDAIRATAQVNAVLTDRQRVAAAERLLGRMVRHGTTSARVHVEIDGADLAAVDWHVELARAWADRISLQLVAFPQQGLSANPETLDALAAALDRGCDVVGGCPYADPDSIGHIREILGLAARRRRMVDFHVDFTDDPSSNDVDTIVALARDQIWRGRVAVGHVTALAAAPAHEQRDRIRRMATAGISLIALPATDLYLGGREAGRTSTRSLAPVGSLVAAGVNVAIATNNTCNAFTPYGDGSLLQCAWLAGLVGQLGPGPGHRTLIGAITDGPARILGRELYGLRPGARADLVVLDVEQPELAVAGPSEVVAVLHRGNPSWVAPGGLDGL